MFALQSSFNRPLFDTLGQYNTGYGYKKIWSQPHIILTYMGEIAPLLLGGLILFLYAITQLSEVMKGIFSAKAKFIIEKYTKNVFSAIIIGAILTIALDSSSAVIILTIVFINSKLLSFKQAIGIIMGANIGTTISSQIIAMDIAKYAIVPLALGLIFEVFAKKERTITIGKLLLFGGMLFFGLYLMGESVSSLNDSDLFKQWIAAVNNNYLHGTLIGGLITLIIQSSSGTVGIALVLGQQNLITVAGGIAIMLGTELGTCADTLLATIKGNRQAIKAGLFHLFFNFLTIAIGLIFFLPFVDLVKAISAHQDIGSQIANAHVLFNILGVILFLPFIGWMEKLLNWMLPDKMNTPKDKPH